MIVPQLARSRPDSVYTLSRPTFFSSLSFLVCVLFYARTDPSIDVHRINYGKRSVGGKRPVPTVQCTRTGTIFVLPGKDRLFRGQPLEDCYQARRSAYGPFRIFRCLLELKKETESKHWQSEAHCSSSDAFHPSLISPRQLPTHRHWAQESCIKPVKGK